MTKVKRDYNINDIINIAKTYLVNIDEKNNLIIKAYNYVDNILGEKTKLTILNVLSILTTVYADEETLASCILYRLFDDPKIKNDLEEKFGKTVVKLSFGIYKLNKITLSTENDYLVEYYKKVIVGMSEDVRMIIISLSERVELMRSIGQNPINDKKIAKETLEIFAPIAHHLGIYKLKSELEDMSLRYLKPEVFYDIKEKLNTTKIGRDNTINEMMSEVSKILTEHNIKFEIKGRSKSIYSIYNKLDKGRKFSDIYDLLALRILVENEATCYLVLGLIHSKFKPIPKRFKDFIAMPKNNGYQSLHTTVFGINNLLFEIQIRTFDMNEVAENGLAAHWSYKEKRDVVNINSTDAKLEFFKQVIDMNHDEIEKNNIYNKIKEETAEDNIYVFTPKGDVIELPKGSTPVDFAYRVHSKIGDSMVGAIVNNQIVPLNYILEDNDVVKIQTSKSSSGPKEGWLKFVKLTTTKNKIKSFFVKNRKEELILLGKNTLDKELKRKKIILNEFYTEENIKKIIKTLKIKNNEELYIDIGTNKISSKSVINIIYPDIEEEKNKNKTINTKDIDINVEGICDIRVNISSCCNPLPGDEIIGYITKNNGISIHRKDCLNINNLDRLINVKWNTNTKNYYLTTLLITLKSNQNHLGDILNKITLKNIRIDTVKTMIIENVSVYKIEIYIPNKDYLDKIIIELLKLRYVKDVRRK